MGFRAGNQSATQSSLLRRALGCGVIALVLLLGACSTDQPSSPATNSPAAPTRPSVTIGPVTVADADKPDTLFQFRAEAKVPKPPKTLRCQIAYDQIVFTAAGTMAEESDSGVDFTLTVATAALDFMESLFPSVGVQVICTADGAETTKLIDRSTGEVIAATPSPKSTERPPTDPANAPAIQVNIEDLTVSPDSSSTDFVVTVEGGTPGAELDCAVTDLVPSDVAVDSATLAGGTEEHRFELELSKVYKQLAKSGWFIYICEVEKATAYETVARPGS